jgi:hypothetical protein
VGLFHPLQCAGLARRSPSPGFPDRELGDHSRAKSDIAAALLLTEQTVGRNDPIYAAIGLIYARVLRATGASAEAAQKEAEVSARLDAMRHSSATVVLSAQRASSNLQRNCEGNVRCWGFRRILVVRV